MRVTLKSGASIAWDAQFKSGRASWRRNYRSMAIAIRRVDRFAVVLDRGRSANGGNTSHRSTGVPVRPASALPMAAVGAVIHRAAYHYRTRRYAEVMPVAAI